MTLEDDPEKEAALAALEARKMSAPNRVDNASLPQGSPLYFYCTVCGHPSDVVPEASMITPKQLCPACESMKAMGYL